MCAVLVITQVLLHFLRVNAQMYNLDKQKTAQGLKTLCLIITQKTMKKKPILENHKKEGKKLIPPLLSFNMQPRSYVQYSIPEIIWIAVIIKKEGLELGTHLGVEFVKTVNSCISKGELPYFTSWYSSLSEDEAKIIIKKLKENHIYDVIKKDLQDFLNVYPESPFSKIFKSTRLTKANVSFVKDTIKELFDKRSWLSTFSLGNIMYFLNVLGKLHVVGNSALAEFPKLVDYPNTEISKMIASSVRATSNVLLGSEKLKNEKWISEFWNRGFKIEPSKIQL